MKPLDFPSNNQASTNGNQCAYLQEDKGRRHMALVHELLQLAHVEL